MSMISSVSPDGFVPLRWNPHPAIYKKIVSFDSRNDGRMFFDPFNSVKLLDLWFYVDWSKQDTSLVIKNNSYAYTGEDRFIAKNRFPVLSGDFSADTRRLISDFKGRLARFRQICSSRTTIFIYLFIDFRTFNLRIWNGRDQSC